MTVPQPLSLRQAWQRGRRTRFSTNADWDDALVRFSARYCPHSTSGAMCPLCHAWCDGFSDIEFHDTAETPCDH